MSLCIGRFGALVFVVSALACGSKGEGDGGDGAGASAGSSAQGGGGSSAGGGTSGSGSGATGGESEGGSTSGGSSGSSTVTQEYSFDTDVEGFIVQYTAAADGVDPIEVANVMLDHDADTGEPDPGAIQLDIPFAEASQYVGVGLSLANPVDLTGKKLSAYVMIDAGYGDETDLMTAPGNAKLYVKTGEDYVYASAAVANLTMIGTWVKLTFDPALPGYTAEGDYDPADVREIGVQFDTNADSTTAAPATVLLDSVSY